MMSTYEDIGKTARFKFPNSQTIQNTETVTGRCSTETTVRQKILFWMVALLEIEGVSF